MPKLPLHAYEQLPCQQLQQQPSDLFSQSDETLAVGLEVRTAPCVASDDDAALPSLADHAVQMPQCVSVQPAVPRHPTYGILRFVLLCSALPPVLFGRGLYSHALQRCHWYLHSL